jgi:flagellar basal-body rod protein FlgB
MRPEDAPVMALLRQSLSYYSDRQEVLANNVANANTPGFTPQDISQDSFRDALEAQMAGRRARSGGVTMQTSQEGHMNGRPAASSNSWKAEASPDSQTTINGNSVVLEEQMVRAQENRLRYETAMSIYQKNLNLIRMAIRPVAR